LAAYGAIHLRKLAIHAKSDPPLDARSTSTITTGQIAYVDELFSGVMIDGGSFIGEIGTRSSAVRRWGLFGRAPHGPLLARNDADVHQYTNALQPGSVRSLEWSHPAQECGRRAWRLSSSKNDMSVFAEMWILSEPGVDKLESR
jgi:hypothetical protein